MMNRYIIPLFFLTFLSGCTDNKNGSATSPSVNAASKDFNSISTSTPKITKEVAYQGVNNYCHRTYDWSIAKDNPSIMYVQMGDEETQLEYHVIFHSYTGAFVYFYVNKLSGSTRMVEYVPSLDIKNETDTINLFDYLDN